MNEYIYIQICNPPILIHYGDWIRARHQPLNSSWNEHWRVIEVPWRAHFLVFRMDSRNPVIGILYPCNIWVSPSISPNIFVQCLFGQDVAHVQFRARIAFKLVWAPPDFNSFVLVADGAPKGRCWTHFGRPNDPKVMGWWDVIGDSGHIWNTSTWLWVLSVQNSDPKQRTREIQRVIRNFWIANHPSWSVLGVRIKITSQTMTRTQLSQGVSIWTRAGRPGSGAKVHGTAAMLNERMIHGNELGMFDHLRVVITIYKVQKNS